MTFRHGTFCILILSGLDLWHMLRFLLQVVNTRNNEHFIQIGSEPRVMRTGLVGIRETALCAPFDVPRRSLIVIGIKSKFRTACEKSVVCCLPSRTPRAKAFRWHTLKCHGLCREACQSKRELRGRLLSHVQCCICIVGIRFMSRTQTMPNDCFDPFWVFDNTIQFLQSNVGFLFQLLRSRHLEGLGCWQPSLS